MLKLSPLFVLFNEPQTLHIGWERARQMAAHGTDQSEFVLWHCGGELLDDKQRGLDIGWMRAAHKDCVRLAFDVAEGRRRRDGCALRRPGLDSIMKQRTPLRVDAKVRNEKAPLFLARSKNKAGRVH